MYRLIRFYNQNRGKFWFIIIVIIFIFVVIQLFNAFSEQQLQEQTRNVVENANNVSKYEEKSESMVSGGKVSDMFQEEYGELLDSFLSNCISGNYEQAYQLLSKECKEELYPALKSFQVDYCDGKFNSEKEYDFQSWISDVATIYQVKIHDNILQSGNANMNYIEDYYTIVKENGENKISISGFVDKKYYNDVQGNYDNIIIKVKTISDYMNYEIIKMEVENNTDNPIMLDSKERTDGIYVVDSNGNKNYALLNENKDEDLIIEKNSKKEILIKFAKSYQSELFTRQICFSNVVLDYNSLLNNETSINYGNIEIQL